MLSMRRNIISEIMFRRYIGWYANIKSENTVHRYNIEREKKRIAYVFVDKVAISRRFNFIYRSYSFKVVTEIIKLIAQNMRHRIIL